ncbi:hypothetical protein [Umezawaea sp. Da 62-37]|uniref:hypothetical protein n=1 Tax=Umezawaea sp. Da 62-37 TaxID=3075927 RepID=UPI0028F6CDDC|nr:hypothetical protein [Umezawaea sp. Da 62-37]WNV84139.1 hypothetical protein RM788_39160 [Umezawaea sp. Da 62-37]
MTTKVIGERGTWHMVGDDHSDPRLPVVAAGACALAAGSLAVGASLPWLAGVLAVGAVVVVRLARRR